MIQEGFRKGLLIMLTGKHLNILVTKKWEKLVRMKMMMNLNLNILFYSRGRKEVHSEEGM